jgi:transposase
MAECGRNIELMWLMGRLCPDFRTISDFRKENAEALRRVFREFVILCDRLRLYNKELLAVDGSKFRAQNSDDKCYNAEILEKKLVNIDEHIGKYLRAMDKTDEAERDEALTPAQVKAALAELRGRKEKYEAYLKELSGTGKTQILETDPDAHRMHSKDGFHCCYNVQTAVDGGSHLIAEYEVTSHNTDQGLLNQVCVQAKKNLGVDTIEAVADKGYESREDIENCLMNGTMPNVALKYDKAERVFNIPYTQNPGVDKTSSKPEDIRTCLYAGILPDCYKNTAVTVEVQEQSAVSCFTKNEDRTVKCPMGCILTRVKTKGKNEVFANKDACRQCKTRCTSSSGHKTVSFGPNTDCVPVRMYGSAQELQPIPTDAKISTYNHTLDRTDYPAEKKVVIRIKEDKAKLKERMCLSEHPFGTVKWYHGAHYLLCRGKEKVSGELGLSFLAYNLRRAITLVGVPALIRGIQG